MQDDTYTVIGESVTAAATALDAAVDPAQLQAERAEKMAPFGPDGPWKYAPKSEREQAQQHIGDEQAQRAGVRLFELQRMLHESEPTIEACIAQAAEAPEPLEAFSRWSGTVGHSRAEQLGILQLAELQRARFERDFTNAKPVAVLHDYRQALVDPYSPQHAQLIAYVERRHAIGWDWPQGTTDADLQAVGDLSRAVMATRAGRVPDPARQARAAIQAAKQSAQRARDLHKVRAVRP